MHTLFFGKGSTCNQNGFEVFVGLISFVTNKDVTVTEQLSQLREATMWV